MRVPDGRQLVACTYLKCFFLSPRDYQISGIRLKCLPPCSKFFFFFSQPPLAHTNPLPPVQLLSSAKTRRQISWTYFTRRAHLWLSSLPPLPHIFVTPPPTTTGMHVLFYFHLLSSLVKNQESASVSPPSPTSIIESCDKC